MPVAVSQVQLRNFMVRRVHNDPPFAVERTTRTFGQMAEFARAWLARHGFGTSNNRITEMCRAVIGLTQAVDRKDPQFPLIEVAMHDLIELVFIMEYLDPVIGQPLFQAKMLACLADDGVPRADKTSHGRDAQFEVLLGAIAVRAGLRVTPSRIDEPGPDWRVFRSKFGRCTIEAKRVKSRSDAKVTTRVLEAFEQIDTLGHPGIAVIDVTARGNPRLESQSATDDRLRDYYQYSGDKGAEFLLNVVFPKTTSRMAGGVVIHETVPRPASSDGATRAGLVSMWNYTENPRALRRARRCTSRLWESMVRSFPNY